MEMWSILLCFWTFSGAASSNTAGHTISDSSCACTTIGGVHARTGAGLSHSIVGTLNSYDCFMSTGNTLTRDGYHWYELLDVFGHHSVWVAGDYLSASPLSSCGGNSGTHFNSSSGGTTQGFATGLVSQHCLECICQHGSACRPVGCRWDVFSNSCGYFQLKQEYWQDCGKPGSSLVACAADLHCSSSCVQKYMARFLPSSGCAHNCESYARIHSGGPAGCYHSSTLLYWGDIQKLGCSANS